MRPSERAANLRRARRRTLFAPSGEPRSSSELDPEITLVAEVSTSLPAEPSATGEFALEEFVIDDDDYPEVAVVQRRSAPAASAPDRVDDIDEWLEEFAVADGLDTLPY
jgi:hypothetical protein